jgi:hypothetical protein
MSLVAEEPEEDVSALPKILNSKFKTLDTDSALRPTIINVGKSWRKRSYKSILAEVEDKILSPEDLDAEKAKVCFTLFVCLFVCLFLSPCSRSGV